ncbi:MAG: phage portal protein [Sedimentisphaerales bacterium]|nr:phage portal protein [Sedimentisphaerales bacterium]
MINFLKRFIAVYNATKYTGGNPAGPQYWVKKLFGAGTTLTGIEIDEDTALKYSAIWAAVNIISGAVGFLPVIAYKRLERGKERLADHPVAKLMHSRPNPYMDALTFKEVLQAHVLLWGNGYAEIERNGAGHPVALWPLLPNKTEPKIEDNRLAYKVYQPDKTVTLPYVNVLHIKGLGFDGLKGYSVIQYAAENLSLGMASERNAAAFFGNDSSPTGILYTDDILKKETKEEVEKVWEEKHKGLDKRYRIAVLHSGLKWQQVGISAKDSQLIESRKFSVTDVARWFTMPPHMLADLEKATFSNIEHQGQEFVTLTLAKWLKRWELESSYKLFASNEQDDYFLEFLVDALLRGDTKSRAESYQIALGGNNNPGYMTINEVREKENLPAVPGGDELFKPSYGNNNNFSALLDTAWQRIANREVKAVRKAYKKPERFEQWIDGFYDKHKEFAVAILKPVYTAKQDGGVEAIVLSYIEGRRLELKEAFESDSVESLLGEWEIMDLGVYYEQAAKN